MAGLTIDTEIHEKDTGIHSSLEYINGYRVFSSDFSNAIEEYNQKEAENISDSIDKVFYNEITDTIYDDYFTVMQSKQTFIIRNEYISEEAATDSGGLFYFAVGIVVAAAFILLFKRVKRKRVKQ